MKRSVIIGLVCIAIIAINSCSNNKYDKLYPITTTQVVTCDTSTISYSKDIVPIVQNYCYTPGAGCHDAYGAATSGYNFTTYAGIQGVSLSRLLLGDINWASGNNEMPKNAAKLSACDINKFTRWINQGALNN